MSLNDYVVLLRRRWLALALSVLAGIVGGVYHVRTAPTLYTATSRTLVNVPIARGLQDALAGAQLTSQLLATFAQVASSRQIAERVVTQLHLQESADELRHKINATVQAGTFIVAISVTDADPERAASLADAVGQALADKVRDLEAGNSDQIQADVLDEAGVPTSPTSPRPKSDIAIGLVLGLVGGVALIGLLEALDRTVKTTQQGEELFSGPLLGMVGRRRGGLDLVAATDPNSVEAETFRALRTAIRFRDPDAVPRVVLVTSPSEGDGKSSVAANLALSFAAGGDRVVLVDADLRRATLTEYLGLERSVGVSTVVARVTDLGESLQEWSEGLAVLPAGVLPPLPAELLGSQAMVQLLETLAEWYDIVLVDTPPVLSVTDAVALAPQVDAVILVARYGRTTRHASAEAARRLNAVGARIAGFVLNAVPPNDSAAYASDYRTYAPRAHR